MNLILLCLVFSVIFVKDNYISSEKYSLLLNTFSLIKVKEEVDGGFWVSKLGSNSKIIVDKGIGDNDKLVSSVFGDVFSIQFTGMGLSSEQEEEMNKIFVNECNADVFSFLIDVLSKLLVDTKKRECELKALESSYKRCRSYGSLMRRIRKCVRVEEKYRNARSHARDSLGRIISFGSKVSECVAEISKGMWIVGKHVEVSDETNENECTEKKLFDESSLLIIYKIYYQVLMVALGILSSSLSECKDRCRRLSKKYRCLLSTIEEIEDLISSYEKVIVEKNTFISGCTKYLKNTSGSISRNVMQAPVSLSKEGLEGITKTIRKLLMSY